MACGIAHQQARPEVVEFGLLNLEGLLEGLLIILRGDKVLAVGRRLLVVFASIWLLIWLLILLLLMILGRGS